MNRIAQYRVAEEAAEWWTVLHDKPTRTQRKRFVAWLCRSPAHVAEMLRVARLHRALELFKLWDRIPTQPVKESKHIIGELQGLKRQADEMDYHARSRVLHKTIRVWVAILGILVIAVLSALAIIYWSGGVAQSSHEHPTSLDTSRLDQTLQ